MISHYCTLRELIKECGAVEHCSRCYFESLGHISTLSQSSMLFENSSSYTCFYKPENFQLPDST
jgi:hypothetical protein